MKGISKNSEQEECKLFECKNCLQMREIEYFDLNYGKQAEKCRVKRKKCRVCKVKDGEIRKIFRKEHIKDKNKPTLNPKLKPLLDDLKRTAGWADLLLSYRIVDVYTDIFGIHYTELTPENELMWMYHHLKEYYKKSILTENGDFV